MCARGKVYPSKLNNTDCGRSRIQERIGMTLSYIRGAAAALLAGIGMACSTTNAGAVRANPEPAATGPGSTSGVASGQIDRSRYSHTPADVHFMSAMIGHHAQAIVMARMAPSHGASPSIRRLAERVINAQEDEIAIMQQWLRDRGEPVPEPQLTATHLMTAGSGHAHAMPGMLTEEQMKQLDQARGEDFDRLFLTFMIRHHRGAVSMVKELLSAQGAAQDQTVFKLASDINVDQTTEIDRMQEMLAALLVEPSTR
jgi:uncharacterized protein (DUF305 family)